MGDYFAKYQSCGREFDEALTFHDFCQLKKDIQPRNQIRGGRYTHDGDMQCIVGRLFLPTFDGSSKCSTKAWVEKIDIYFQINQMAEREAIKVAALHLEGEAHGWWFHGMDTLGHSTMTAYVEFK